MKRLSQIEIKRETEANLFAMYLLMPEHDVRRSASKLRPDGFDIVEDAAIPDMAKEFRVTEQLMILRLVQLGYFDGIIK